MKHSPIKQTSFVWRVLAGFLCLSLIVPNPAFALRPLQDRQGRELLRAGLEELSDEQVAEVVRNVEQSARDLQVALPANARIHLFVTGGTSGKSHPMVNEVLSELTRRVRSPVSYVYLPYIISDGDVGKFRTVLRAVRRGIRLPNGAEVVTVSVGAPFKTEGRDFSSDRDPRFAVTPGAEMFVRRSDGQLWSTMIDAVATADWFEEKFGFLKGLRVVVLGLGGVGSVFVDELEYRGAVEVTAAELDPRKAEQVRRPTRKNGFSLSVVEPDDPVAGTVSAALHEKIAAADVVFNMTGLGKKPASDKPFSPLVHHSDHPLRYKEGALVVDMNYWLTERNFLTQAQEVTPTVRLENGAEISNYSLMGILEILFRETAGITLNRLELKALMTDTARRHGLVSAGLEESPGGSSEQNFYEQLLNRADVKPQVEALLSSVGRLPAGHSWAMGSPLPGGNFRIWADLTYEGQTQGTLKVNYPHGRGESSFRVQFRARTPGSVLLQEEVVVFNGADYVPLGFFLRSKLKAPIEGGFSHVDAFDTIPVARLAPVSNDVQAGYRLDRIDRLTLLLIDRKGRPSSVRISPGKGEKFSGIVPDTLFLKVATSTYQQGLPFMPWEDIKSRLNFSGSPFSANAVHFPPQAIFDRSGRGRVYVPRKGVPWNTFIQLHGVELERAFARWIVPGILSDTLTPQSVRQWDAELRPYFQIVPLRGFERAAGLEEDDSSSEDETDLPGVPIMSGTPLTPAEWIRYLTISVGRFVEDRLHPLTVIVHGSGETFEFEVAPEEISDQPGLAAFDFLEDRMAWGLSEIGISPDSPDRWTVTQKEQENTREFYFQRHEPKAEPVDPSDKELERVVRDLRTGTAEAQQKAGGKVREWIVAALEPGKPRKSFLPPPTAGLNWNARYRQLRAAVTEADTFIQQIERTEELTSRLLEEASRQGVRLDKHPETWAVMKDWINDRLQLNEVGELMALAVRLQDDVSSERWTGPEAREARKNNAGELMKEIFGLHHRTINIERNFERLMKLTIGHSDATPKTGLEEDTGEAPKQSDADLLEQALQAHLHGDLPEAVRFYTAFLERNPNNVGASANLAAAWVSLGELTRAIELYERIQQGHPENADILSSLGAVYLMAGQVEDSWKTLERAVQIEPNHSSAWVNLSAARSGLGRREEAIAAGLRTVELDPHDATNWHILGLAYAAAGRFSEAVGPFRKAVQLNPRGLFIWLSLGSAQMSTGDFTGAESSYKKAVLLDRNDWKAWSGFVDARMKAAGVGPERPGATVSSGFLSRAEILFKLWGLLWVHWHNPEERKGPLLLQEDAAAGMARGGFPAEEVAALLAGERIELDGLDLRISQDKTAADRFRVLGAIIAAVYESSLSVGGNVPNPSIAFFNLTLLDPAKIANRLEEQDLERAISRVIEMLQARSSVAEPGRTAGLEEDERKTGQPLTPGQRYDRNEAAVQPWHDASVKMLDLLITHGGGEKTPSPPNTLGSIFKFENKKQSGGLTHESTLSQMKDWIQGDSRRGFGVQFVSQVSFTLYPIQLKPSGKPETRLASIPGKLERLRGFLREIREDNPFQWTAGLEEQPTDDQIRNWAQQAKAGVIHDAEAITMLLNWLDLPDFEPVPVSLLVHEPVDPEQPWFSQFRFLSEATEGLDQRIARSERAHQVSRRILEEASRQQLDLSQGPLAFALVARLQTDLFNLTQHTRAVSSAIVDLGGVSINDAIAQELLTRTLPNAMILSHSEEKVDQVHGMIQRATKVLQRGEDVKSSLRALLDQAGVREGPNWVNLREFLSSDGSSPSAGGSTPLPAGLEESLHPLGDFHRAVFTRIRRERPDLWDEKFGRYAYTITAPEETAETVQRLRERGYFRNVRKAADLGSGQGAVVHAVVSATTSERINVTGFEIDSALVGEARVLTEELSGQGLVDPARVHWREENYLSGDVDLREYDLLFMNPSVEGLKVGTGVAFGFISSKILHKLVQKMKPGALLVFSGETYLSSSLGEDDGAEYLPEVRALRRIGPSLERVIEQHLESAWPKIEDYEKQENYTGVIEELQGLPEIPPAYRTAKVEQFLRHILPVQSRVVEFLGRPFMVHDANVPEETRRQWVMAAAQLAAPLLVHRNLLPPESWDEKRAMGILLVGMMIMTDVSRIPREAAEQYLLDPALHLPERGVSFAMSSAASWELSHAAGPLLDRRGFSLHHPSIEWPMVKALAHYVIALSSEPTGVLVPSFEQDLLTGFIGFVGSYYGIGDPNTTTDARRARYDAPLERVVKELKLGPVPSELIQGVYREDKAALFNLAAIGAEILARVADQVGDDTQLHEWAGYYAGEAHTLKPHRFFRSDLFPMAEPRHIESGLEEGRGFVLVGGVGLMVPSDLPEQSYFAVAVGSEQVAALIQAGRSPRRIIAVATGIEEVSQLAALGIPIDQIEQASDWPTLEAAKNYAVRLGREWLTGLGGLQVSVLEVTARSLQGILAQLLEILPSAWQTARPITAEDAARALDLEA